MRIGVLAVAVLPVLAAPQAVTAPPSVRELNGFLLGQYNEVLTHRFGKPYKVLRTEDDWEQRVYILNRKNGAYMVFEFAPSAPSTMYAIQITGTRATSMIHAFHGLHLGDPASKVADILGVPAEVKDLLDIGGHLWLYAERNYSVEINPAGMLSSIRIKGYAGFPEQKWSEPDIGALREALRTREIDATLQHLTPDVEVFRGNTVRRFKLPARADLVNTKSGIHLALFGATRSVRSALLAETSMPQTTLRFEERRAAYPVAKFPKGKYISEIIYKWHAGRWRVWEVHLK